MRNRASSSPSIAFGYTQQVELVQESYADGNLAVTAYLSDPTDESFGQPWSSVTVNFGSPLQQDATVFLDTNNMGEAMLSKISQLGAFTGQFMRSGFCSYRPSPSIPKSWATCAT